ncbi:MAG: glycoside hydrolase family 3 C-terminal domain-containing protein [Clostridiales Family XIII bacterium]|jgi:beta-glucosidase-like glycosyl hydrolase|nr:glycoside hydrolase family 3 C-terminal domain-containing protein [Clostridiales Family XIII bacterium]
MMKKRILSVFALLAICGSLLPTAPAMAIEAESAPAESPYALNAAADDVLPYLDTTLSYEERAADLVSRMSLAEKQAQLKPAAPAIPRLGLRQYQYQNEALHGIMTNAGGVSFPSPIATASSWNRDLMLNVGQVISNEIRAYYNAVPGRGLVYYSPTMNLLRDPRWGRNEEAYSEDPFLTAAFGEEFVRGMQGIGDGVTNQNPGAEYGHDYIKIAPTIKHYAANNSERNRNSGTYDVDNKTLRDYYTWAFQRITEKTDVASVMSAYNRINGIPCSANGYLLNTLLRQTFGFTGFVVNDCGAINDTILNHKWVPEGYDHSVTPPEAVALSIKAGNNMDCGGGMMNWVYDVYTVPAVDEGLITEDEIDHNLYEILLTRFRTGEFDGAGGTMAAYSREDGYEWVNTAGSNDPALLPESRANRDATLEAALQGAVLLKNEGQALPVDLASKKIKVFGPLMNVVDLGDYSGQPKTDMINFRAGMTSLAASKGLSSQVEFYDGMTPFTTTSTDLLRVRWIGFYPGAGMRNANDGQEIYNLVRSGGSNGYLTNVRDGSYIKFSNIDLNMMSAEEVRIGSASGNSFKTNAEFRIDSPNGQLLATVSCPGTGGNATYATSAPSGFADITAANRLTAGFSSKGDENGEFDLNGFNRNVWDYYRSINDGIHDIYVSFSYDRTPTLNAAQIDNASHDGVSVLFVGTTTANSSSAYSAYRVCSEASDRPNIKFPAGQEFLVNAVAEKTHAAGGKVVVVIQSVGTMDVSPFIDNADAVIWTAYNGQRQGEAHAMLVLGDYNPGGHLTQTWYTDDSQLYSYPDEFLWDYSIDNRNGNSGRTYMYFNGTPRYPFGYGLSYTDFTISDVNVSGVDADGIITVTANVRNNGAVKGAEVVQVYVQSPGAGNGIVPKQQLKGFARVELDPGQTKPATIKLEVKDLAEIDPASTGDDGFGHGKRVITPGEYKITVAYDSVTPVDTKSVTLTELPQAMKVVTLRNAKPVALVGDSFGSEVTVSMTDETFLEKGASGLAIAYSSSDPSVATVDPGTGEVTAVSGGTALITATFTYGGQTMKDSYPVSVADMASLNSLSMNGAPLTGFRYNKFIYDVKLPPASTTEIPEITYTVSDDFAVEYIPAEKLPGISTVTVRRGDEAVTYQIRFTYEDVDLEINDEELANFDWFASQGPLSTGTGFNNGIYYDWRNVGAANSGSATFNLQDYDNRDGLYLTFTMNFSAEDESVPFSRVIASAGGGSNAIRFRSPDAQKAGDPNGVNNREHNFGWRITSMWEMGWGKNYVRIPLSDAISRSITSSSDYSVPSSEYTINVNGKEVPALETHLGLIDWADVRRMILMVWTENEVWQSNKITLSLEDVKIVDAGFILKNISEEVATFDTFANRGPWYTTNSSNGMYADWTSPDGVTSINLKNHPHRQNLYLEMTMTFTSSDPTLDINRMLSTGGGSSAIRLRSVDAQRAGDPAGANNREHNFGWRPTSNWGLVWGSNKIQIPLGKAIDYNITSNSNRTVPTSEYMINVNGVDRQVVECSLGIIDWSQVNRIITMVFAENNTNRDADISMALSDVKIVDKTVDQMTKAMRADLESLLAAQIPGGGYTSESYQAYMDAYTDAAKINAIAEWPTPLQSALKTLQAAINGLVEDEGGGEPFTVDFADSSAYVRAAAELKGFAIAAVYNGSGALVASDMQPIDMAAGSSARIGFALSFSEYPKESYTRKVFFWDAAYLPLTEAFVD